MLLGSMAMGWVGLVFKGQLCHISHIVQLSTPLSISPPAMKTILIAAPWYFIISNKPEEGTNIQPSQ
jgi:hypothetical protein